jgi:hypothetical protein
VRKVAEGMAASRAYREAGYTATAHAAEVMASTSPVPMGPACLPAVAKHSSFAIRMDLRLASAAEKRTRPTRIRPWWGCTALC